MHNNHSIELFAQKSEYDLNDELFWTISKSVEKEDCKLTLEIEEQLTGYIYRIFDISPPFKSWKHIPEGYYDARIRLQPHKGRVTVSNLFHFNTMKTNYFEDANPRPKHILSMDEGDKFEHSRMFKILNITPGQVLSEFPMLSWITTINKVVSFDVSFFNKKKKYWVFLRNVRSKNVTSAHALEQGEWFVFIKATRDMGQIWSFPLFIKISANAEENAIDSTVKTPKYMNQTGDYFNVQNPKVCSPSLQKTGNGIIANFQFIPKVSGVNNVVGLSPMFKWEILPDKVKYDLFLVPSSDNVEKITVRGLSDPFYQIEKKLEPGEYKLSVHGIYLDNNDNIIRRIRSSVLDFHVSKKPFNLNYLKLEKEYCDRLEKEKVWADSMDTILSMDYYTNLKLKGWEVENGVSQLYSMPSKLTTLVGYNCNIDCYFCDNGRVHRNINIPDSYIEEIEHLMPFARNMQILGGEPLMIKGFRRIVEMAEKFPHLELMTTTNGTLVDDMWAYYFARSNFSTIWMSVDGATEDVYQSMRRGGKLKSVVDGVKKIVSYGEEAPFVGWSFIICSKNYKEIINYYKLARDIGVKKIFFKMIQLRFGPNYPGVGNLDVLMDRDICKKIMEMLLNVAQMAKSDGIEFDERVVSYVRHVFPELTQEMNEFYQKTKINKMVQCEVDGVDIEFGFGEHKKIPKPIQRELEDQKIILYKIINLHKDLCNNKSTGVQLNNENIQEFCDRPFTHLGLNGTNAYMCCYATDKVLPILFGKQDYHLLNIWNSERYQFSRKSFFNKKVDSACLKTCPMRKDLKGVWSVQGIPAPSTIAELKDNVI